MAEQIALNIDCMEYMKTLPDKAFELAIDKDCFEAQEKRWEHHISQMRIEI